MAGIVRINFFRAQLTAQLLAAGTTVNITAGQGARFASINFAGSDKVRCVLQHMTGYLPTDYEIVDVTGRSTDALTISRAVEDSASYPARQFEINDWIICDPTAAVLAGLYYVPSGFADGETPGGTINSSNVTFTLNNAPSPATSLNLFLNGVRQRVTTDYSLSGLTITFVVGATPQTGDNLVANYRY